MNRTFQWSFLLLWRLLAAVGMSSILVGCITEPITGRTLWAAGLISEAEANEIGVDAYRQILSEAKLSADAGSNAMVESVGRKIARVVDGLMAQGGRAPYEWEFKVIDAPKSVNAFALPGGKIAFYTGILPVCRGENGVAVVMGHEIAHAFGYHGQARVSRQVVGQVGLVAARAALGGEGEDEDLKQLTLGALGVGFGLGKLTFDRGDESSADHIGLILMARAGYDPREAVAFWERMQELSGGEQPPEFLSTHPSHETRIADLQALMPGALEEYERSGGTPSEALREGKAPAPSSGTKR